MTVLQKMCRAVEVGEAEYADLIGMPQKTREMWLPSATRQISHEDRFDRDVKTAEELVGKGGFENFRGYVELCQENGVALTEGDLKEIYDEYWSYYQDEEIENQVNDLRCN